MIWSDATLRSSTAAEPHAFLAYVIAFVTVAPLVEVLLSVSAMATPVMVVACSSVPVRLVATVVPAVANPATTQLLVSNVATLVTLGFVELVLKFCDQLATAPTPEYWATEHVDTMFPPKLTVTGIVPVAPTVADQISTPAGPAVTPMETRRE